MEVSAFHGGGDEMLEERTGSETKVAAVMDVATFWGAERGGSRATVGAYLCIV